MSQLSVAFFGATGGCALGALERTIKAGIPCSAQSKLLDMLAQRGLDSAQVSSKCRIVHGDIRDVAAIKRALQSASSDGVTPASVIVSGIGATPSLQLSLLHPVSFGDFKVCRDGVEAILAASGELNSAVKPLVVLISTTGISRRGNDVPTAMKPLYHWLLKTPHEDKRHMELKAESDQRLVGTPQARARGLVVVRASLLVDGKAAPVRSGWESFEGCEKDNEPGPAIGHTISRESVGAWIFETLIKGGDRDLWAGRAATITAA